MAIQTINIGNLVNDGLGDNLRTAFQKVNDNFTELGNSITVTASNLSATGEGLFKQKTGNNLEFKSLLAGTKVSLSGTSDAVVISSTAPDAFTSITTNAGVIVADANSLTTDITIQGGDNLRVTATGRVVTVDSILDLNTILQSYDFGPLSGNHVGPVQFAVASANIDFGLINIVDGEEQPSSNTSLDMGSI